MSMHRIVVRIGVAIVFLTLSTASALATEVDALRAAVTVSSFTSSGSAFCIADTRLLSAEHVVDGSTYLMADSSDSTRTYRVKVLHTDAEMDLALLDADEPCLRTLELADELPAVGSVVHAIGSPIGAPVLSEGTLTGIAADLITAEIAVAPGSSGGPLLDQQDHVIGVVVQRDDAGNAYAVPLDLIRAFLEQPITETPASPAQSSTGVSGPTVTGFLTFASLPISLAALVLALVALTRIRNKRRPLVITLDPLDPQYKE